MGMRTLTCQVLAQRQPELKSGFLAYAHALFVGSVGFNSACGYWVSAWIGNVGNLLADFGALGLVLTGLRRGQYGRSRGAATGGLTARGDGR